MVNRSLWAVFIFIVLFLFSGGGVSAAGDAHFDAGADYRTDGLRWNIAGNLDGQDPNILSELTWSGLRIFELVTEMDFDLTRRLFFRSSLGYGRIGGGDLQDSDYSGDNRTLEFSRSINQSHGDDVWDGSFSLGYRLITNPVTKFVLSAGYSRHLQNLRMTDGYQIIPDTGSFEDLNSTYKSSWNGPWVGIYAANHFQRNWRLFGNIQYHWAEYYGEGNWNLRDDLAHPVSFVHQADGAGLTTVIGVEYATPSQWLFNLSFQQAGWSGRNGVDQIFLANGATGFTRLNEVTWNSSAIFFKIGHFF